MWALVINHIVDSNIIRKPQDNLSSSKIAKEELKTKTRTLGRIVVLLPNIASSDYGSLMPITTFIRRQ